MWTIECAVHQLLCRLVQLPYRSEPLFRLLACHNKAVSVTCYYGNIGSLRFVCWPVITKLYLSRAVTAVWGQAPAAASNLDHTHASTSYVTLLMTGELTYFVLTEKAA